jgi:predicted short-subunit dehydrogenase-like oxidoreductase (DUF2520 family)
MLAFATFEHYLSDMAKSSVNSPISPLIIVGLGAVGRTLAREIARSKIAPLILVGRGRAAEQRLAKQLKAAYLSDLSLLNIISGTIWLTVSTSKIGRTSRQLSELPLPWKRICVFHASGSSGASVLGELANRGAGVAACHPYQTFPKRAGRVKLDGILWGLDGNARGLRAARGLTRRLRGIPVVIPEEHRLAYHASAVMACTFMAANSEMALTTLKRLGVRDRTARDAVFAIALETLRQVQELGLKHALTGPASRGDKKLVRRHVAALKELDPAVAKVYGEISEYILKSMTD